MRKVIAIAVVVLLASSATPLRVAAQERAREGAQARAQEGEGRSAGQVVDPKPSRWASSHSPAALRRVMTGRPSNSAASQSVPPFTW